MQSLSLEVLLILATTLALTYSDSDINDTEWSGKWFPAAPGQPDMNPLISLHDEKHGIKMGIPTSFCDDGQMNLQVDWNGSPDAYTCYESKKDYAPDFNINPESKCVAIPKKYSARHICMNSSIEYDEDIPTFGAHRPLWPRYGEYKYVPKQRWLHNLEHGAVVMLYHPCASESEVMKLKNLVKGCLFRHVISPYNLLDKERPLALITWGCRLTMSVVDEIVVTSFIKVHALQGPEEIYRDGQYDEKLIDAAKVVSNKRDSDLCPNQ